MNGATLGGLVVDELGRVLDGRRLAGYLLDDGRGLAAWSVEEFDRRLGIHVPRYVGAVATVDEGLALLAALRPERRVW